MFHNLKIPDPDECSVLWQQCQSLVPVNVFIKDGTGETMRKNLLEHCDHHTLLRLSIGIFCGG